MKLLQKLNITFFDIQCITYIYIYIFIHHNMVAFTSVEKNKQ